MSMTIAEKILARHCGKKTVRPEEFIYARVDLAFANDITAPLAIKELNKVRIKRIKRKIIALIPDHFTPNKDIKSAQQVKILREFAYKYKIKNYFEIGEVGIEHALLPELGLISPGDLVIGADSHTCTHGALGAFATGVGSTDIAASWITGKCWFKVPQSIKLIYEGKFKKWVSAKDLILYTIANLGVDGATYKVMEFSGDAIKKLDMDERFTICNMAIEAGAKTGIIEPDEMVIAYLKERIKKDKLKEVNDKLKILKSDSDAKYSLVKRYNVSQWEPAVACPHLPSNVKPVSKLRNIKIDQAVIGSCTNGRISDLRIAAKVLKGKKVKKGVRLIILPATPKIYFSALKEGLIEVFLKAGAVISPPTCGPCLGGHMGVLAEGEVCISTTNRNFQGRMGSPYSFVYLANPAVVAASAVKGKIIHPEEL